MKTLTQQLGQYAKYHRDKRNIMTHYIGIPLIVVSLFSLLSLPQYVIAGIAVSPALLVFITSALFYFRLDIAFGLVMLLFSGSCFWLASCLVTQPLAIWLASSVALFVIGWILQFIGHYFEGKKPAFTDDLMGLVIGPLFIVAELSFLLGLRKTLRHDVEQIAGKTY